jgi:hypothetical protein
MAHQGISRGLYCLHLSSHGGCATWQSICHCLVTAPHISASGTGHVPHTVELTDKRTNFTSRQSCLSCDRMHRVQALRHFYVLACNPRIMRAIDVHVRQPVYVPVSLSVAADATKDQPSPAFSRLQAENTADAAPVLGSAYQQTSQANLTEPSTDPTGSSPLQDASRYGSRGLEGLPSAGQTPMLSLPRSAGNVQVTKRLCPCIMPEPDLLQAVQVRACTSLDCQSLASEICRRSGFFFH